MGNDNGISRRGFFALRADAVSRAIRPPWAHEVAVVHACTGCGACVSACPQATIRLDAARLPTVDFRAGECTLCAGCVEVCPEPVFDRAVTRAFQHRVVIGDECFTVSGIVCQTCGDRCPEAAIRFPLRRGGPAVPSLALDRCSGCGACIAACPAGAISTQPPAAA